ncbi:ABC-F family ATPase [Acidithiobacillus sp. CV18-2]|uniref:Probable ATP-binding protein YbiT n=1 Tax=Igneacidithiobacillus copahuensis TaxID=2724909 RepID=A0AAE2YN20_9PROT|nr:ABC-F family ATPase [Igneacidithiobacillus copahuensis]MBU2754619.1 ABC-F family ATPase [Acidithiobacillus sp. CV18-3]MBU2757219.1 ABC-F family ATPase [Acidithiobacillus sp. BN09-2]MBU2776788.1 ABC-F family ATPase [Acidithiobacillus sp. CV18-2]MBU2796464.1 ABC-F family ATPase [Acidithiobacillus sp. VAN18-2]MBU2799482.1 ABC-F family ATPase [Acidithiobacillus sp. VAN18-4]UTV81008.1 ABC-F family ATPase [Acidithiobacillus sp. YTS05]
MLSTHQLTMQFASKPLFENVSVEFGDGNRYGLIGANGSGKTTLMKILGGDLEPSSGNVSLSSGERLGKLRQDQFAFEEYTVLDTVMMGHAEFWRVKQERDRLYALAELTEEEGMAIAQIEGEYAELDGYSAEARAGELLIGVGIPLEQHTGLMSAVAPGWKLRVLLAQALFADPDILLLDEPTNNLDIHTIQWLEELLSTINSTIIIISHDRHFLNSVCTHMADLDYGELRIYPGNYDEYMRASTLVREQLLAENDKKREKMAELQTFVSRFSANASKAKQATSRARQLEKIQLEEVKPSSRQNPYLVFQQERKLYRHAVDSKDLGKSFGELRLFHKLRLQIEAGERVAIIGANGLGKTTLLRCLLGEIELDTGTVKWAENARIGYFPQDYAAEFAEERSLFAWMSQWRSEKDDDQIIRGILGRLLFGQDQVDRPVQVLSGGEKGRMLFGKLTLQRPNVLILDEPTNHLDMESIESLNTALEKFDGTLIFVSHDREFVSSLATRIIEFTAHGIEDFKGSYEDYLRSQQAAKVPPKKVGKGR